MFGLSNGARSFYEYTGRKGPCRMRQFPAIRRVGNSCTKRFYGNEEELKALVAKQPVVAAVSMTAKMMVYKSGIFSDPMCPKKVDHALVRNFRLLFQLKYLKLQLIFR